MELKTKEQDPMESKMAFAPSFCQALEISGFFLDRYSVSSRQETLSEVIQGGRSSKRCLP